MSKNKIQTIHKLLEDKSFILWLIAPTPELSEKWEDKINENPEIVKWTTQIRHELQNVKVKEQGLSPSNQEEMWKNIRNNLDLSTARRFRFSVLLKYAAIFCALLSIPLYLLLEPSELPVDYHEIISKTEAEKLDDNSILLVVGDKEKLEITEDNVEMKHDAKGNIRIDSKNEKITIQAEEEKMNRLYVPYGKRIHLLLSDGTKVWVNSGTNLIYPAVFKREKREIFVDGEVYLDVAHDESKRFVVKTNQLDVSVLGTHFNVSAYGNDNVSSVVLVEGSVQIKEEKNSRETNLRPDHMFSYYKNTGQGKLQTVDVQNYISWKEGFLIFKNEKLSQVLRKLERYYNVQIDYNPSETDETTLSGKLDLKENIQETFRIIAITAPIDYEIRENKVKINVKP
ncbi:MAG: DUF4974 domain-containing protein [Massilibacteroides sp.]|nr:DUF4974 domain-containing protein [Massilibacteroides sp.]MDD3063312.1 DUF4974 domain-containing protein [Massilibacteroides sp.]MDD4115565.1 DUF4974 domain-containing protein [Massilibacteroides sp.]MDD4661259.1 DUF4974 domain-containing protein [Massilibacteroides sp.]